MSAIIIKNLTFGYDASPENVFENLTAALDSDWKLGLVGRNGKGKTTFLRLLNGDFEFSGAINAGVNFEYFPAEVKDEGLTVREVLYSINDELEEWEVLKELNVLGVRDDVFDRIYSTLSKGEQSKVMIAALFNRSNAFLLIDEPTNHLDAEGRAALAKYLKRKSGFIAVSHDRTFLDGCIDHVMSINRNSIEVQSGNVSAYLENKRLKEEFEAAKNERLNKDIKRLGEAAKRTADWSNKAESEKYGENKTSADRGFLGAKAAKIMSRAKAVQKRADNMIKEKSALLKDVDRTDSIQIDNSAGYVKERLLTVKDLSVSYDGASVFEPLSFELFKGDKLRIKGGNGSGKSSLIKAILLKAGMKTESQISYSGDIACASGLKISYVAQDTSRLYGTLNELCEESGLDKTKLFTYLNKLGVEKEQYDKDISGFSEGQRKKLLIAKCLCEKSNLYIWDEPLNFIDLISRQQIENMLYSSDITLIFIEHDEYFGDKISTKTLEL